MLITIARGVGRAIGGLLTRKITSVDAATGEETATRKATPFGKGAAFVLGTALLWHFVLWPILNYHFPHYGFPAIDAALLSVLAGMGW